MMRFVACVVIACVLAAAPRVQAQDLTAVALNLVRQGAEGGSDIAQVELANRLMAGKGVLQNRASAAEWYLQAAEQGNPTAQNAIGKMYHAGLGVERDEVAAVRWLAAAAQGGVAQHLHDYATVLEASDPAQAAASYARAAEAGHVEAAVSLGVLYQSGSGVAKDAARALSLFEAGAKAGNPRAMNNLGLFYVRAEDVPQDYDRAAALFAQAAELGLPTAMTNLGVMYENGYGVPVDADRAATLYRMASSGAAQAVATFIYDPRLRPVTLTQDALADLKQAADAEDPIALFQLGWVAATQDGADFAAFKSAAALFRDAAELGYGPAMANLGLMYFNGQGVPQDYVLGHMWVLLATLAGTDTDAISLANSGKLTSAQVNAAEQRALARIGPRNETE